LRRPTQSDFGFDVAQDEGIAKALVTRSGALANIGACLSGMREVGPLMNGGAITAQFAGEGRGRTMQLGGDKAQ